MPTHKNTRIPMPEASVCATLLIWEIIRIERLERLTVGYLDCVSHQKQRQTMDESRAKLQRMKG